MPEDMPRTRERRDPDRRDAPQFRPVPNREPDAAEVPATDGQATPGHLPPPFPRSPSAKPR